MKLVLTCFLLLAIIVVAESSKINCYQCGGTTWNSCERPGKIECETTTNTCVTYYYKDGLIKSKDCIPKPGEMKEGCNNEGGKDTPRICWCTKSDLCNSQTDKHDDSGSAKLNGFGLLIVLASIIGWINKN